MCVCVYLYIIIASRDFFLVLNTNMNDSLKLETYRNILLTQSLGLYLYSLYLVCLCSVYYYIKHSLSELK